MSQFQDWAQDHKIRVERVMCSFMDRCVPENSRFANAVRYAVQTEGKRIRPLLAYATAEAIDVTIDIADYPAAAVELVHTYSLVHDDLPAMDDDDLRRGQPTVHKAFDEATAILVGDALLTHSFQLLADADVDAELKALWVSSLAKSAGASGMVQGQATDLEGEVRELSLAELEAMHQRKTGALIEASLTMIARVVGDAGIEKSLAEFAGHIGLAFQVRDDILDVESSTLTLGKPSGSDASSNKSTFVSLLGIEASRRRLQTELEKAHAVLDKLNTAGALRWLTDYIVNRKY